MFHQLNVCNNDHSLLLARLRYRVIKVTTETRHGNEILIHYSRMRDYEYNVALEDSS